MIPLLIIENSNPSDDSNSGDSLKSKQELLEEVQLLRKNIVEMETDLRDRKAREQSLSGAIKLGFWEWDETSNRPDYLSNELAAIFGFSQEQLYEIYQNEEDLYKFIHPEDLEHYRQNLMKPAKERNVAGRAHVFDYRIIRPDGEIRHVREMEIGVRESDGQLLQSFGAVQDTTEYHRLLMASKKSEEKYSSLFSQMPLGVLEQDYSPLKKCIDKIRSQGIENIREYFENNGELLRDLVDATAITAANEALLRLYKTETLEEYCKDDEDTRSWWNDDWVRFYASEIEGLLSPTGTHLAEPVEESFDGTKFDTRMITKVMPGYEDSWQRVITLHDDVTERKQNQIALIAAKESAEQASKAKSEFLATMSHEIRTPMNGVLGMTELLMGADLDMHARRLATTAYRSAESLLEIINDILDFSKIEADKMELADKDFDLREVLEAALDMVAGQAHRKGLECIADLPPDLPRLVRGDAVRLRQVLINLLGNAVKFTELGEVRLLVRVEARSADKFQMIFEISDTGPGIPLEQQTSIFDAFSQVDSSTSRRFGGTGLGLAISSRLVDLMSGQIELENTPGNGALFRIRLPLATAHGDIIQPKLPESLIGLRLLIVDDYAINRDLLHNQVSSWGMRDDNVDSGQKAIEAIRRAQAENDPYQIVLLDWHMPDMDGLELAKILTADSSMQTPKLVLLSSSGFDTESSIMEAASISRYLQKPVRQQLLLDCLCEVMAEQPAQRKIKPAQKQLLKGEILLVEDNPVNQLVALGMLNILGCKTDLAENGKKAVLAAKEKRYDLILMDCHLPEMNGFTASKHIREYEDQQALSRTPIVALTADIKKGIEEECTEAGMDSYLSKPFKQDKLAKLLNQWLTSPELDGEANTEISAAATEQLEKILDLEVLSELRKLSQTTGRDIIGKSIRYFLQQTPEDVTELRRAASKKDLKKLGIIAHSLKSSSANLGAVIFSKLCNQLEDSAREERIEIVTEQLLAIETLLPRVLFELRQEVDKYADSKPDNPLETQTPQLTSAPTILIVDDDPGFRFITGEALKAAGFNVIVASCGEEALPMVEEMLPDIVLLDAIMPGIEGFEVCRQIRKRRDIRNIPVMILTGLGDMDSVNRAFESGATDFIVKPINFAVLSSRIQFQLRVAKDLKALHISQEWLASAQRIAGIGYWQWDSSTDNFVVSEQLAELLSLGASSTTGSLDDYINLIHPQDQESIRSKIVSVSQDVETSSDDYQMLSSQMEELVVHQELARLGDSGDIVLGTVQNITRQRESEKRIRQLAYSDALTGLASRAYFHKHLEDVVKASHRRSERFALLFLDLDGFKEVNDSLGHDAGDMLLKQIARRLQAVIRGNDFVARLGGDEFCIMIDIISDQYDAAYVANRCLENLNEPVNLGRQNVRPRCSIGIAYFPDDGDDSTSLLKAADSAMYAAKESGKHRYMFYQPEFTEKAESRLLVEQDLRQSIENGELELYYQPQIDLRTGRIIGVEALVRWNHPSRGMILPLEFIDIAERIDFMKPLDLWVLKTACKQARLWREMGLPHFRLAVNISPSHFQDLDFVDRVEQTLKDSGYPGSDLELEVTESVTQPTRKNLAIFTRLQKMGVNIAIDDFGTGYSSLAALKELPINCLKIDRLFIIDMLHDPKSSILLGTIVGVAHALGHIVVAEGVEEEDQVKVLNAIGCDIVQGYFFSEPVPATEIPGMAHTDFLAEINSSKVLLPTQQMKVL